MSAGVPAWPRRGFPACRRHGVQWPISACRRTRSISACRRTRSSACGVRRAGVPAYTELGVPSRRAGVHGARRAVFGVPACRRTRAVSACRRTLRSHPPEHLPNSPGLLRGRPTHPNQYVPPEKRCIVRRKERSLRVCTDRTPMFYRTWDEQAHRNQPTPETGREGFAGIPDFSGAGRPIQTNAFSPN